MFLFEPFVVDFLIFGYQSPLSLVLVLCRSARVTSFNSAYSIVNVNCTKGTINSQGVFWKNAKIRYFYRVSLGGFSRSRFTYIWGTNGGDRVHECTSARVNARSTERVSQQQAVNKQSASSSKQS